jgi:PAS domain S-box-containing protein
MTHVGPFPELVAPASEHLVRAAHALAVGTGEAQFLAAVEHLNAALGGDITTLVAVGSDPSLLHVVVRSRGDVEGEELWTMADRPDIQRAFLSGQPALTPAAGREAARAVFPLAIGRKNLGALVVELPLGFDLGNDRALRANGRLAAGLVAMVFRNARVLEPIRERTRKISFLEFNEDRRVRAIERFRSFFDSTSDGIVVLDPTGLVLYMNRAAELITGYARDGLLSREFSRLVPSWHQSLLEEHVAHAAEGKALENFDLDLVTTSGDRITVSVASIGMLAEYGAAIFSFRDVTLARDLEAELRQTTEFLERILNSTVDGIIAADLQGTILLFNQGAERICGYRAADVIGHMNVRDLYPAGIAKEVMRLLRSSAHGGAGRLEPVRRELRARSGEHVPVSISAALVVDDEGREMATVGIFTDLRDRLRMEERLASAQEKLAVSEKQAVAVELAGAAAHELNQPLTSIMGYAQMLQRRLGADNPHGQAIKTILAEAERMAGIVRRLGSLTRYETKSYVGGAQILDIARSSPDEVASAAGAVSPGPAAPVSAGEGSGPPAAPQTSSTAVPAASASPEESDR